MKMAANRSTLVVGASVGLLAMLLLYCIGKLWVLRQGYVEQIEYIAPRTARLVGVLESEEQLIAADQKAATILEDISYPAFRDAATTGAAMQKDVRELMVEAGMSVTGSQVLPRQANAGFDRLTLEVTADGNTEALEQTLAALELMRPLVFVSSLSVKQTRVSRRRSRDSLPVTSGDTRKVTAKFKLISLRLKN
ncbi:MAG: type II secretion system protein GspM [Halioglobus sp.]